MPAVQPTWGDTFQMPATVTAEKLERLSHDGYTYELYEAVLVRGMTTLGATQSLTSPLLLGFNLSIQTLLDG